MSRKIRVMIVEDSLVVRELLRHIVGEDGRFEIVAAVESAEQCLELLPRLRPDVISLDIRLPGMNGLDATLRIMASQPTPIVVVAAQVDDAELNIAMNALRAGALAVVEKPVGITHEGFAQAAQRICTQLAIMSEVRVIGQGSRRPLSFGSPPLPAAPLPATPGDYGMLGIAASTGGPQAVAALLAGLGPDFPLPILLVQHMTPSFMDGFVAWLGQVTGVEVRLAVDGKAPQAGCVHVAPAELHLELEGGRMRISHAPPLDNQRPAATLLFASMARELGPRGIGVVLTGMGADGARGLREMAEAGAYTLAEDASTCVVNGMPAAAIAQGAVREVLPLSGLAARLLGLVGGETS